MGDPLKEITEQSECLAATLDQLNRIHGGKSETWDLTHRATAFGIAALAGVTAAGVVADAGTLATVLAIASAILAAANIAFKPDDLRDRHKNAADRYGKLKHDVDAFVGRDLLNPPEDEPQRIELWDRFQTFTSCVAEIGTDTPNVARALEKREQARRAEGQA